jgi:hypothetical protein
MVVRAWAGGDRRTGSGARPGAAVRPGLRPGLRTGLLGTAVLLASSLLTACGGSPEPAEPAARIATQADCLAPQVLSALELVPVSDGRARRTAHPDVPAPGRVPDDFVPESVVTCTTGGRLRDSSGTWAAVTRARLEGDLEPLLALLGTTSTDEAETCDDGDGSRTVVWLVDALGRAVRPLLPVDECGGPSQGVMQALAHLDGTDSKDYPVELLAPRGTPEH